MANERIGRENDSVVKSAGGHDTFLWGNLQTAIAAYQTIVNEQAELMRSGDELSLQGSVAENACLGRTRRRSFCAASRKRECRTCGALEPLVMCSTETFPAY